MTPSATLVRPAFHTAPAWDYTLGPEVVDLVAGCSDDKGPFRMDPEQALVLDDWFGVRRETEKLVAFEGAVVACRQNIKTGVLKAAALGKVFIAEQRLVVWTAHEFFAAREAFRDIRILLESNPILDAEVVKVTTASGSEAVEFRGDRRLLFKARTSSSARSLSGDTVILDEGFALTAEQVASLIPTLAARPDPQVLIGSSAGMETSAVLMAIRDRGRKGAPRTAYAEWKADERECAEPECWHEIGHPGCALDDQALWLQANTAITRGRINLDTVAGMRTTMAPEQFSRECLGWWPDPRKASQVIDPLAWEQCVRPDSTIESNLVFALDVSPLQSWASIVAAGFNTAGVPHLEVTSAVRGDLRLMDSRPGVGWVVARIRDLAEKRPDEGLDLRIVAGSAAEALVPSVTKIPGVRVQVMASKDYSAACGYLVQSIANNELAHLGQHELTAAVVAGAKRETNGLWQWVRVDSDRDITALVAATAGLWAITSGHGISIW